MKKRPRVSEDVTLDAYLREISRFPPLSRDEERDLAGRIKRHRDQRAFKRLVEANLRFVVSYAQRYRGLGVLFLDLIDEGNLGLMEAARRFDPDRNGKFTGYAAWWIRQAIMHALGEQGRVFAAPGDAQPVPMARRAPGAARPVDVVDAVIWQEMAELFDLDDLAPEPPGPRTTEAPRAGQCALAEDDGIEAGELLRREHELPLADATVRRVVAAAVREVMHELAPREREIARLRFGLDGGPMTFEEIADHLQLPRDRVRQIDARARGKMRRSQKARELRCSLN